MLGVSSVDEKKQPCGLVDDKCIARRRPGGGLFPGQVGGVASWWQRPHLLPARRIYTFLIHSETDTHLSHCYTHTLALIFTSCSFLETWPEANCTLVANRLKQKCSESHDWNQHNLYTGYNLKCQMKNIFSVCVHSIVFLTYLILSYNFPSAEYARLSVLPSGCIRIGFEMAFKKNKISILLQNTEALI